MVATDWTPILQTGLGAITAIGGGMAAAWLQGKSQERIERRRLRREEDVEGHQRRERAAEVLANVSALLGDIQAEEAVEERLGSVVRDRPDKLKAFAARSQ